MIRSALVCAGVLLAAALAGCASGSTAAPAGSTTPSAVPDSITISSTDWPAGGLHPPTACAHDGDHGRSPAMSWRGAPANTKYYAITIVDPDFNNFSHWAVLDIPANITTLRAGVSGSLAAPAVELTNGFGWRGYGAPCPPSGQRHHYLLTVFALTGKASSQSDVSKLASAKGQITATFGR